MKIKNLFLGVLGCLILTGCSEDRDEVDMIFENYIYEESLVDETEFDFIIDYFNKLRIKTKGAVDYHDSEVFLCVTFTLDVTMNQLYEIGFKDEKAMEIGNKLDEFAEGTKIMFNEIHYINPEKTSVMFELKTIDGSMVYSQICSESGCKKVIDHF